MSLITCQNVSLSFAQTPVLRDVTFSVEKGDKIGCIGVNGSGKTTLFRLLTGELTPDEGKLFFAADVKIGCVEQHACHDSPRTVYEELRSVFAPLMQMETRLEELHKKVALTDGRVKEYIEEQSALTDAFQAEGGLTYVARTHSALAGLGFTKAEEALPVSALSGGQRTKLSLGKLLLSAPDVMLLDEPTNHLDIDSVEWLEDFLSKFGGALIVISHDRYFLDKVTARTMELRGKRLTVGKGGYSAFIKNREQRLESDRREYEKGMLEIERLQKMIEQQKRFNRERNYITIASKEKQIERIKASLPELPPRESTFRLRFGEVVRTGDEVIHAEGLTKGYDGKLLFRDVGFSVRRGEKVFLLGPNGCGKSTLLQILMHRLPPDAGFCRFGQNAVPGFFEQSQTALISDKTVIGEVYDAFPRMTVPELRGYLGAFCFKNDDIDKTMRALSGGERARVALLELILKKPNLLLLDEPTNHLDAASREILEEALAAYEGTLFCVSHDRYFVNRLADRILYFDGDAVKSLEGNYDAYAEARRIKENAPQQSGAPGKKPNAWQQTKDARKAERQKTAKLTKIERELQEIEARKEETAALLQTPEVAADYEQVLALTAKLEELTAAADTLEEAWLTLTED